jgi:hypothetical protein
MAAALCAEAARARGDDLAAIEGRLDEDLRIDPVTYAKAVRRDDAAQRAYAGFQAMLARRIENGVADAWMRQRHAEELYAASQNASEVERTTAAAELESAKADVKRWNKIFTTPPDDQAAAIASDLATERAAVLAERAAAGETLAATQARDHAIGDARRTALACLAARRQALGEDAPTRTESDVPEAAKAEGTYTLACGTVLALNHSGRIVIGRAPDGRLNARLIAPPERGGVTVTLDGVMDPAGFLTVAENPDGGLWILTGRLVPDPARLEVLLGSGNGSFTNPAQGVDCTVHWETPGAAAATDFIGEATMQPDGTLVLNLVAHDEATGTIGHAQFVYPPGHPDYQSVLDDLGGLAPGEAKPVPAWPD